MFKKKTNERCIEIFNAKFGGHFAESFFSKVQKQAKAIAISRDGVWTRLPLPK
jgi:hypothetical protein